MDFATAAKLIGITAFTVSFFGLIVVVIKSEIGDKK